MHWLCCSAAQTQNSSRKEGQVQTQTCWRNKHPESNQILLWSRAVDWHEESSENSFWINFENVHLSSLFISLTEATICGGDLHCRCSHTVTTTLLWAGEKAQYWHLPIYSSRHTPTLFGVILLSPMWAQYSLSSPAPEGNIWLFSC